MGEWEEFLERLLASLHHLHERGEKVDVLILMGRRDRETRERKPETFQIRRHGF